MTTVLPGLDSAPGFLRDGYLFGSRRFDDHQTNSFRTRLAGVPVVVMRGGDACRFFYEGGRFERSAALPPSVTHLLQDAGSVQTLAGDEHRRRKQVFVDALTTGSASAELCDAFARAWTAATGQWATRPRIVLGDEVPLVLARAVFDWAGIRLSARDERVRTAQLVAMIDNAGRVGPANWAARARRMGTERWARELIADARDDPARGESTVVDRIARATDASGRPLPVAVAAVELINVLRPFVAVSRFVLFAFLGLRRRPDLADRFRAGDDALLEPFAQEVRRFYPFFPVVAGRATGSWRFADHDFAIGDLAMLDLYGTDNDPAFWGDSHRFRPERFLEHPVDPNHLIAQGGGTYLDDHRCPGEPVTVSIIAQAVRLLTRHTRYRTPPQDLRVSLRRFPTAPQSGVVLTDVRALA